MIQAPVFRDAVEMLVSRLERTRSPSEKEWLATAPWEDVCVVAFWSGPFASPEQWQEALCCRDRSMANILENSLRFFRPRIFLRFFSLELFIREWPFMRGFCPHAAFHRRGLYDMLWSLGATGTPLVPPLSGWFELDANERKLLLFVLGHMGKTAEEYARRRKSDQEVVQTTLNRLEQLGFILKEQDKGQDIWFRANAYIMYQIPRPVEKIRYTIKKDGKIRTTFTPSAY